MHDSPDPRDQPEGEAADPQGERRMPRHERERLVEEAPGTETSSDALDQEPSGGEQPI